MEQVTNLLNVDSLTVVAVVKAVFMFLKVYAAAEEA
jgi:hypothetical protein